MSSILTTINCYKTYPDTLYFNRLIDHIIHLDQTQPTTLRIGNEYGEILISGTITYCNNMFTSLASWYSHVTGKIVDVKDETILADIYISSTTNLCTLLITTPHYVIDSFYDIKYRSYMFITKIYEILINTYSIHISKKKGVMLLWNLVPYKLTNKSCVSLYIEYNGLDILKAYEENVLNELYYLDTVQNKYYLIMK